MVAFDKSKPKVSKLTANCERHGIQCVKSFVYDGIKALDAEKHYNRENCEYMLCTHTCSVKYTCPVTVCFFKHFYFGIISVNFVISFSCLQASTLSLVFFVSYCFVLITEQRKKLQNIANLLLIIMFIDLLCRQKECLACFLTIFFLVALVSRSKYMNGQ